MILLKVHPGKFAWNLKITQLKRKMIFQTSSFWGSVLIFRGVRLLRSNLWKSTLLRTETLDDGNPVNLVYLRNPWGHKEWNGDWADQGDDSNSKWKEMDLDDRFSDVAWVFLFKKSYLSIICTVS